MFETVRSASRTYAGMDANQFPRINSMTTSTLSSNSVGPRMSCGQVRPQASTFPSLDSTGHSEGDGALLIETEDYPYVSVFLFMKKYKSIILYDFEVKLCCISEGRKE